MAREFRLRTVSDELSRQYVADGFWTDENLGEILLRGLVEDADLAFKIHSPLHPFDGTWADVRDLAQRVAGGLRARGVGPGDLVAIQFPNWVEGAATFYATTLLGAVPVPIVHFYGPKEVRFILQQSAARTFVLADRFGSLDFVRTLETVRPDLPDLETVIVAGDEVPDGAVRFADLLESEPVTTPPAVDPSTPALIAYTSGTTSDPKGVIHTHRSIVAEIKQLSATQPGDARPGLVAAPIGHGIGMLAALLIPMIRRHDIHLIDVWDPGVVLRTMLDEQITSNNGATYFLTSLLDHPDLTEEHLTLMEHVGMGGSAVPAAVCERAEKLGLSVARLYGSTEHPSTTGCTHADPRDKRLYTDGRALPGVEFRLVDDDDGEVPVGEPGEIVSRGPDCFAGYTDWALTEASFLPGGWYRTGDVGVLDEDGYLAITDRKKDIIIRGGENVSAAEVEEQLLHLPGVAEVAVVAAPDERLGEHGCAFVRMLPDAPEFDLDTVRTHLAAAGLAKQKWPEELRFVQDFPRTASGKIQKFNLRQDLREEAAARPTTAAASR